MFVELSPISDNSTVLSEIAKILVEQGKTRLRKTVYHPKGIENGHQLWYNIVVKQIKSERR